MTEFFNHKAFSTVGYSLYLYRQIDVICVNAYRLYVLHTKPHDPQIPLLSYLQFRTRLYLRLLEYSKAAQLTYLQVSLLLGRRVFGLD